MNRWTRDNFSPLCGCAVQGLEIFLSPWIQPCPRPLCNPCHTSIPWQPCPRPLCNPCHTSIPWQPCPRPLCNPCHTSIPWQPCPRPLCNPCHTSIPWQPCPRPLCNPCHTSIPWQPCPRPLCNPCHTSIPWQPCPRPLCNPCHASAAMPLLHTNMKSPLVFTKRAQMLSRFEQTCTNFDVSSDHLTTLTALFTVTITNPLNGTTWYPAPSSII